MFELREDLIWIIILQADNFYSVCIDTFGYAAADFPDFGGTYNVSNYRGIYPSCGRCLVFTKTFQIIDGKRIAFEFKVIPVSVLHFVEKILIHMPGFQFHDLGRRRPDCFFLYPEPVDQLIAEIVYSGLKC